MKKIGVISYNIHANFTNYGSALQSWALNKSISKLGYYPVLVDYCPECLKNLNILNPFNNMWDKDEKSKKDCEMSLVSIKENYYKFDNFYSTKFNRSKYYDKNNFNEIMNEVDSFVCGSDTIFSPDEFKLDDGYYANYKCMKNNSIAYAASFGDPHFTDEQLTDFDNKIKNFNALGIRENLMIPYIIKKTNVPVKKVLDPTLLLDINEYEEIIQKERIIQENYLLYYSRRYNPIMEKYAEKKAKELNLKVVDISLQASNIEKGHIMKYDAGVEEFLSLIKNASFVVTNSFHGMIFSVQFRKEFVVFSRALCDTKIIELLDIFGLGDRLFVTGLEEYSDINYDVVHDRIKEERTKSINFLKKALENMCGD